jgi:glycosyltransferase involved in cell wall biosynthesis
MNLLYATDFHNRTNSGITFAVNELVSQAVGGLPAENSIQLVSLGDTDISVDARVRHLKVEPSSGPARAWRYAPAYAPTCEAAIKRHNVSVVHIHGLWMYPQFAAAGTAHRFAVPTVLTNHGAVQWALRQPGLLGAAKKRVYMSLMKDRLFRRITVQHAITAQERDALHSFFPHQRIEVVPNFVDVQTVDKTLAASNAQSDDPYALFLGRLHPTKGVDILIEAFGRAATPRDWRLIVIGPEVDRPYAHRLRQLIAASPKAGRIEIRDPIWDAGVKYRLMRDAWITVVPSHTEAISLVNLESSSCFTPTITTTATGLTDWTEGGGLLVQPALGPLADALSEAARWPDRERRERGLASRGLIERRYSAAVVMPRWLDLYRSLH